MPEIIWLTHKMRNRAGHYFISSMLIHNVRAWRHHGGLGATLTALQAKVQSGPRQTAISLSLRDLAKRLCVSQTHVGNLRREAETEGSFRTEGHHLAQLDPSLLAEFELWAACHMIF